MIKDGLTDVFNGYHMGITAENLAEQYQVTRGEQDDFAVRSQNQAEAARAARPLQGRDRAGHDQGPQGRHDRRPTTNISAPARRSTASSGLRPAFKKDGTVTAANATGLNDGAAALVVMSREEAEKRGSPILAHDHELGDRRRRSVDHGHRPGPRDASSALEKAGWTIADLDLIEANEAFAAQALSVGKELGWDADKVNVNGGAIAIGHPIGASGARVLTTLIYEMGKRDAKKGLATLCIGGGMGIAMCLERD